MAGSRRVVNEVSDRGVRELRRAYLAEDVTSQLLEIAAQAQEAQAQVLVRVFAPVAA